jgi:hypothetical protein
MDPSLNFAQELANVVELLPTLSPQEVLSLRLSPPSQERIAALLDKSKAEGLSPEEEHEWEQFASVEHLVRMAKLTAAIERRDNGQSG